MGIRKRCWLCGRHRNSELRQKKVNHPQRLRGRNPKRGGRQYRVHMGNCLRGILVSRTIRNHYKRHGQKPC